jgi:hypothetical protein
MMTLCCCCHFVLDYVLIIVIDLLYCDYDFDFTLKQFRRRFRFTKSDRSSSEKQSNSYVPLQELHHKQRTEKLHLPTPAGLVFMTLEDDNSVDAFLPSDWEDSPIDALDRCDGAIIRPLQRNSNTNTPLRKLLPPRTAPPRRNDLLKEILLNRSYDTTDTDEESSYACSVDDESSKMEEDLQMNSSRSRASVRWSDECGKALETVHKLETQAETTCRIVIVLMNAPFLLR